MPLNIPPNSSVEDILKLAQTQGRQSGVYTPPGVSSMNIGGNSTPNVIGQPGINFETGQPIPSSAPAYGPPASYAPKGPTVYEPAAAPVSISNSMFPGGGSTNNAMSLNLQPYVASVKSLNNGSNVSTIGRGNENDPLTSIMASVKGQYDKANNANEARFSDAKKTLDNYGKSYQQGINEQSAQDLGQQEQDAISRGLGNTTVRQGLISSATRRKNDANLNLQDRLAAQKINLLQSKSDNAPDPMQYAQLLANATQGAYGSGNTLASIAAALGLKH